MADNELLLAISDMMDKKIDAKLSPVENRFNRLDKLEDRFENVGNRLGKVENEIIAISLNIENNIVPQLDDIISCYTDTYNRYKDNTYKMEAAFDDIGLLKKMVSEHSQKLQNIS